MKVSLGIEELWFIQQLVRRTDHLGEPWDREDMRRIHVAILEAITKPNEEVEVELGEGFWWLVENQVPQTLDLGRTNLGRRILIKVFAALSGTEEEEDDIPAVFRDSDYDADDRTDDSPGEAGEAGGNLSSAADGATCQDSAGTVKKGECDE
jgi:hypothetical protein